MLSRFQHFGAAQINLNVVVVAATEELAVHQRHGPHILVPAQHLDTCALQHEAGHGTGNGKALHGVSRVIDLHAPEHTIPEPPHLLAHNKNKSDVIL
jgi:hypothetical protein